MEEENGLIIEFAEDDELWREVEADEPLAQEAVAPSIQVAYETLAHRRGHLHRIR